MQHTPGEATQLTHGSVVDRYEVEHLLGVGGQAEVWCVRHQLLRTRRALKLLLCVDPHLQQRLLAEGRAQANLVHPNLLPVIDALVFQKRLALVLPLIEGPSLAEVLREYTPTRPEALALAAAIVEGLAFAHSRGFVHRDLKPGNVLLEITSEGVVPRISDFGLVKTPQEGNTVAGAVFGTPAYAAPEQLLDASTVDARADLFSLGVLLTELLIGRQPFPGQEVVASAVARRQRPSFGGLKGPLRALVGRLLEFDPARRPGSCAEVKKKLGSVSMEPLRAGGGLQQAASAAFSKKKGLLDPPASGGASDRSLRHADTMRLSNVPRSSAAPASPRHNLPAERDRFVGREAELTGLRRQLAGGARLVTVTGLGGMGKTRLALQAGRGSLAEWPGGVWLCDLTEARSVEGILAAVGRALDVSLDKEPLRQLGQDIRDRGRVLLILDNVEQVANRVASTVGVWLNMAPDACFLATSREPLLLRGEEIFALDVFAQADAEALFEERARAANQKFALTPANRSDVAELVRLLDWLPLAIELAAARSRALTPGQIKARLSQRFALLRTQSTDVPERQRTLEATLAWSWDLLKPWEQAALAQSSVFEGGFTLEAAEAVLDLSAYPDAPLVEDVLANLLDKSLLRRGEQPGSGETRLGMLVSVQQFAAQNLERSGGTAAAEARHGAWFGAFGSEEALRALDQHGGAQRWRALGAEADNLAAACRRARRREDADVAAATALAAWKILEIRGLFRLGAELLEGALALGGRRIERVRLEVGRARAREGRLDDALQHYRAALEEARAAGSRSGEAAALGALGNLNREQGRLNEARAQFEAALELYHEIGDRHAEGIVFGSLGILDREQGRLNEARERFEAALAIHREVGDFRAEGVVLSSLGILKQARGLTGEGELEAALAIHRELGNRQAEAIVLGHLGIQRRKQGRMGEARERFEAALAIHREIGDRRMEGIVLGNLSNVLNDQGLTKEALSLAEGALRIHREVGHRRAEGIVMVNLGDMLRVRGRLEEARGLYEAALAILEEIKDRLSEATAIGALGLLYLQQGRLDEAQERAETARRIAGEVGNRRKEGEALRLLSLVRREQGEIDSAREIGAEVLGIARESEDRHLEAGMLSLLAVLDARQGRIGEARALQGASEEILRGIGDRMELGAMLANRAEIELIAGDGAAARAALAEAGAFAAEIGAKSGSELGDRLDRLSDDLAARQA